MEEDLEGSLVSGEWQKVTDEPALRKEVQEQNNRLQQMESAVKNIQDLITSQIQAQTSVQQASASKEPRPPGQTGAGVAESG
jgi:TolA-binding protein